VATCKGLCSSGDVGCLFSHYCFLCQRCLQASLSDWLFLVIWIELVLLVMHFCDTRLVVCAWFNSREKTLCSYRNLFYYAYRAHMLAWVPVSRCTTVCRRPRPMQQFSPSPCPVSLSKASCRLNLRVCVTIFRSAVDFCLPHGVVLRLTCT